MTTRLGTAYKVMATEGETAGMAEILQMLIEDRRKREEENARREEAFAAEQTRREVVHEQRVRQMEEQMNSMRDWLERSQAKEEERMRRSDH